MDNTKQHTAVEWIDGRERMPGESSETKMLWSTGTVAKWLGVSSRTVARLAGSGLMPPGLKLGNLRRFRREEILSWIEAGCPAVRNGGRHDLDS